MDKQNDAGEISGIPAKGMPFTQSNVDTEVYRDERAGAFSPDPDDEEFGLDYFKAEEERLAQRSDSSVATGLEISDVQEWSEGIADEENLFQS